MRMYTDIPSQANLVFEQMIIDYSFKTMSWMARRIDYLVELITELIRSNPPNFKLQDHGGFVLNMKTNNVIWLSSPYG